MKVVHLNKKPYDVRIDRATMWGNPWSSKKVNKAMFTTDSRKESVDNFRAWLKGDGFTDVLQEKRQNILDQLETLRGKTLGCWCHPQLCHGEVYIELLGEEFENNPYPGDNLLDIFG